MREKKLVIFMPSIEDGGVEKNLFLISNFLIKKFNNVSLITVSNKFKSKFDKKIKLTFFKNNYFNFLGRRKKFFKCLFLELQHESRESGPVPILGVSGA